jgi:uncharacterized membrane protein YqjE
MRMEAPRDDRPHGLFGSLKALIERVLALLQSRAELFSTELEEELTRLIGVLIWSIVGVFCAIIGVTFIAVTILLAVPSSYRVIAAGVLALLFLGVAAAGALTIRKIARAKPRPFDASLSEIEKDRERLRSSR